jgi:hypothetical protein
VRACVCVCARAPFSMESERRVHKQLRLWLCLDEQYNASDFLSRLLLNRLRVKLGWWSGAGMGFPLC